MIRVVFPVPVGPMTRRWWRASAMAMPTGRRTPVSLTPSGRTSGSGHGDAGRWGDGAGPGAGKTGERGVGGQAGDRGQFGDRQQPAAAEPAAGDLGGGVAQMAAGQPVPPRVQGGRGGEAVRQSAQPRPGLRLGWLVPRPAAFPAVDGGGGGGVADLGVPLRARRLDDRGPHLSGQPWVRGGRAPPRRSRASGGQHVQEQPDALADRQAHMRVPGGMTAAQPPGGAAGLAEPGAGDRAGEDLDDGVLPGGQAAAGGGEGPQRISAVIGFEGAEPRCGPAAASPRSPAHLRGGAGWRGW